VAAFLPAEGNAQPSVRGWTPKDLRVNRRQVINAKRENARIAARSQNLSPQIFDGVIAHQAEARAPRHQRGFRGETHSGQRDLFSVLRPGRGDRNEPGCRPLATGTWSPCRSMHCVYAMS